MRFKLDIIGVGLSASDTIRLIEPGHSCFEDSGDVRSAESTIDWNCPDINEGCATVRVDPPVDIPLFTAQWNCLSLEDDDICSGAAGITAVLVDSSTGTARLTFNDSTPLVNGSYVRLGSGVVCNESCSESQLNLLKGGTSDSSSTGFYVGNRVSIWGSDPPYTIRLSIDDPSFSVEPVPNFAVNPLFTVIDWYQTDRSSTRKELVGLQERSQINVCWNGQGRSNGYTTSAGNLDIIVPGILSNLGIYPVTRASGISRAVPLIVAFRTSSSSQYLNADGIGEIIISVLNPQALSIVTVSGSDLGIVSSLTPSQDVCGRVFLELWSSKQGTGFPFPRGCWVDLFAINDTVTGSEIHVTFNAGNGLARNTDYQLVVNVMMNSSLISACGGSSCDLLKLQTVANIETSPFEAIELGFAQLSMENYISSSGASGPSVISGSLTGGINGSNTITLMLYSGLIQPGNVLRVIFGPLTQWSLSSVCSAAIILLPGDVGYVGALPLCEGVGLVPGAEQLNVINLQLPLDMPAVSDPGRLSIEITGIVSPGTGFYNSAVSVEVSHGTHLSSSFVQIASTSLWKYPDASSYLAQIVGQPKLTDFTYAGNSGVVMLVNVMTGITVSTGMEFSILLPTEWECVSVLSSDDHDRSFLTSAIWTVSGPNCTTSLNSGFQIYYQSQFYVKIIANVPIVPKTSEDNIFSFEIKNGNNSIIFPFSLYNESSTDFFQSVSVLGSLQDFHIEPVSSQAAVWTGSKPGGVFAVFLTPQQTVSDSGFIRLSLPRGYSAANASDLFDYIYAVQERSSDTVNKLPGLVGLSPTSTDPLVVWIQFEGTLRAGKRYAFGITLLTPEQVNSTAIWQIRTADEFKRLIDGSRSETVPLIPTMTDSFGPYQTWVPLTALVADFTPFSLTGIVSNVTLSFSIPSSFPLPVNARLTLPSGFAVEGAIMSDGMSIDWETYRSVSSSGTGASNVVLFSQIQLSNDSYTMIVPVSIPDRPPVHSLYKFRLEFGFDLNLIEKRLVVAESDDTAVGPVKGLDRATVEGLNWIANQTNTIKFEFQSHALSGKITVEVPSGFEFPANCSIVPDRGLSGLSCHFERRTISINSPSAILPGILSFYITGTNPASPVSLAGSAFVISTYYNNSSLEVPVSVQAFPVTASMGQAGFVNSIGISRNKFPGRDDRPNYRNSFILFFSPLLANATNLFLRAPKGFLFDANCLPYFTFDPTQVFGLGVPWPPNYHIWPSGVAMSSCVGFNNTASLVFSHPLPSTPLEKPYAIKVGVQSNPPSLVSSADSQWQITLDMNQSCDPFQTFPLRTFDPSRSNITGMQAGAGGLNIVTVTVKPFSPIVNGSVVITVPHSFSIPVDSCNYNSFPTCSSNDSSIVVSSLSTDIVSVSFAVLNPPEPGPVDGLWIVQSFSSDESPLDESRIPSSLPAIVQSPLFFNVSGYRAEGLVPIPSLKLDLKWPLDINEMHLEIAAPHGIFFTQDVGQNVSVEFNGTMTTSFSAFFDGTILNLSFPTTVAVNTLITVTVSVLNAESTPVLNFFKASLMNISTTIAQGVAPGWSIVPQLREVSVVLAGPNFAAGNVSNIDFSFTATNPFDELNLVFVGNFKFSQEFIINLTDTFNVTQAVTSSSFSVSLPLINTAIISFNEPIDGGTTLSVSVRGILLWDIPGSVFVSIVTKRSGVISNSRLRFPAFYLAGLIHVVSSTISTASHETALSQLLSPNSQLTPYILPRTGESANLKFTFVFDIPLLNGSFISITNPPYAFLNGSNVSQTTTGLEKSVEATAILPATISEALSNFLITTHLEFSQELSSASNTNDASTGGFRIVYPIDFQLHAERSPPGAQIELKLNVTDIARTFSFILVAPQGYSFPTHCISESSPGAACSRGPIYDSVLPSAVISFPSGITVSDSLSLYVITP